MERCDHNAADAIAKFLNQSKDANLPPEGIEELIHDYFLDNSGDLSDCLSDDEDDAEAEEDTVVVNHLLPTIEVETNKGELSLDLLLLVLPNFNSVSINSI